MELLVQMQQLPAGILQEEFANQDKRDGEDIHGQGSAIYKDRSGIGFPQKHLVRNKESELAHEPEAEREQYGNGDEGSISNHRNSRKGLFLCRLMDYFPEEEAGVRGSRSTPDMRRSFEG